MPAACFLHCVEVGVHGEEVEAGANVSEAACERDGRGEGSNCEAAHGCVDDEWGLGPREALLEVEVACWARDW